MKLFCDKCKVELEETISHCPLCGRCVNEEFVENTSHENFPDKEQMTKNNKEPLLSIFWFLILANILCIFAELLLEHTFTWSLHILVASAFIFLGFILPVRNHWYLVNAHAIFYIVFTLYIIFLETYTKSVGWGISYVIPLFALGFSIYNFILIISNRYNRSDYILPLIILTFIATGSFLYNYFTHLILWPSLSAFFVLITFISASFIFRATKIIKAIVKKFHI